MSTTTANTAATTASTTLRDLSGLENRPPRLAESVLIMIDFQNTYRTGVMALEGAEEAVAAGARLLERARAAGTPVVHVVHDGGEGSPYDVREHIGALSEEVAPADGEPVVVKNFPNAFHATELEKTLTGLGFAAGSGKDLVLAGFMTHMCITFTAQQAFNLGYRPTVVAEATATRALAAPDGTVLPAAVLQSAALTTITDMFGVVVPTAAGLRP
ncbi:nicotinamidase-related amidase [Streptomyces sp. Ag109_G2-6]|uniref:cysteine hydrolase family protein n=1 Tax=Streptomyces sp. Ag109_G2-6 TaxID=2485154 RepID=UPI000FBE9821|nr:cysteine hydrolase family protein [Streptomyces sp. Ag109_G2-6]RPF29824.1 nicotinamidase-related amidase [Streptomyces sp. Ag109_G2-6]